MAMSRSDLGMLGILAAAGLGFFFFTARKNEKEAKEANRAKTTVVGGAANGAELSAKPANGVAEPKPSAMETSVPSSRDAGIAAKFVESIAKEVEVREPFTKVFPGEFSAADVEPNSVNAGELSELVKSFSQCKGVTLVGHTDGRGSAARNRYISVKRAEAVKVQLVNAGISASLITVRGLGETTPNAPNDSTQGRNFNRRVDISCIQ